MYACLLTYILNMMICKCISMLVYADPRLPRACACAAHRHIYVYMGMIMCSYGDYVFLCIHGYDYVFLW